MHSGDVRCLVTGATGYIGGRLAPRLLEHGHQVRALARDPAKLDRVPWRDRAEVVRGDLTDPDSLAAAFEGVDVVFYLVHSMGTSHDFVAEEARSARNVVAAAQRAGVRRLVYLSGLHPPGAELSRHLRSRTEVGEILLASGIETVVLQAGIVIGSGSASFEMIRHLTDRLPVMTTPKWVSNKIQPIAIRDVLHYLVQAATAPVPESRTWDIGGPDVLEYGDAMQVYAETAGLHRRVIVVLPWLTPTIASWWVGLVTPIPSGLARPLVESLECDAVCVEHDIDGVIAAPEGGLTRYRDAVELALERIARGEVETSWSDAGGQRPPSSPLPSDPQWAGEVSYTITRSADVDASPAQLWEAVQAAGAGRRDWRVADREPGQLMRLSADGRAPGRLWLEMRVDPCDRGARYRQRTIFYPRGIAGLAYWYTSNLLHANRSRDVFDDVVARVGGSGPVAD